MKERTPERLEEGHIGEQTGEEPEESALHGPSADGHDDREDQEEVGGHPQHADARHYQHLKRDRDDEQKDELSPER